jgi:hypothetical protein
VEEDRAITSSFPQLPPLVTLNEFRELVEVVHRRNRIGHMIVGYSPHTFGRRFSDLHCYGEIDCIFEATADPSA